MHAGTILDYYYFEVFYIYVLDHPIMFIVTGIEQEL